MGQIELSPFARRYMEELKSLVSTDRKAISFLRNLAAENHEQEKWHIVVALQQYLYHECPPKQQLPLLYLVDCILKTDTEHYLLTLSPPLPAMFLRVWQTSPNLRPALTKLANTWRPYLPPQTQAHIDQITSSALVPTASAAPPSSAAPVARWTPPHPSLSQGSAPAPASALRLPLAASMDPRLASSQPRPLQPQQSLFMPRPAVPAVSTSTLPLYPVRTISPAPTAPAQLVVLNQPAAAPGPAPALFSVGQALHQAPLHPAPAFQPAGQGNYPSHANLQQQQQPQYTATQQQHSNQQQQPQYSTMQSQYPHLQQQYSQPSYFPPPHQDPQPQALFPSAQPQPQQSLASASQPSTHAPAPSSSQDIMTALHTLVNSMTGADPKGQPSTSGAAGEAKRTTASQGKVSGSRSFHPSIIKETDESAIDALLEVSKQSRTAFLDLRFLRTRRLRSAEQSGQPQVQPWYYPLDKWMQGVSAEEQEAAAEGLWNGGEEDEEAADVTESNVEEDPSQPECAISGEAFDRWYDPDTDKWFYQGAVVLTGEAAARHGIMDGSIVKVHCLAGEPSRLGRAARGQGAAGAAGAGQAAAAGLPVSMPRAPSPPAPSPPAPSPPPSSPPAPSPTAAAPPVVPPPSATAPTACPAESMQGAGARAEAAAAEGGGICSAAAAPHSPAAIISAHISSTPSPGAPCPVSLPGPSWAAAMGACAVAALKLEPHGDGAGQLHGAEQGAGDGSLSAGKRGRVLEGSDLSGPAAMGGGDSHGHGITKKIKLEFSQAV